MPSAPIDTAIAEVQSRIRRAANPGWYWMAGYAKTKVASDWVYRRLCERIEPGATVLDLGSGLGLLGLLLESLDQGHRVHGIEWDERKVAFAQRLHQGSSACSVQRGNILDAPWPEAEVIVLVDVLHYFPVPVQRTLIRRISGHLGPGGVLFLRAMDLEAGGKARFTRILERLAVAFRWNRAEQVHWRSIQEIQGDMMNAGLRPALCPSDAHFLDGNCLISAAKGVEPGQRLRRSEAVPVPGGTNRCG